MPTGEDYSNSALQKVLYIGDSGTGKTGSLVSLLKDGYKIKMADLDNGVGTLIHYAREQCPEFLKNIEYETYRDEYIVGPNGDLKVKGKPSACTKTLNKMTEWSTIDDDRTIFVLDSLSSFGKSAFALAQFLNPTSKDPRQWYGAAQPMVENMIALLTGEQFRMNVILISHVNYKEVVEGVHKGYANAIGTALGPIIPRYFNTMILAESSGSGVNVRRRIKTVPTGVIDLKIANPQVEAELPLETGMATIFAKLKGETK